VNNGWPMIPLGELMADDKTSVNPLNFREEQFELLSIPAFDAGRPELVNGSEIGSSKSVVKAGDVLLSKIVPHIRRAWIVLPASGLRMLGSSEWIVFRTTQTDPGYLKHFLISDLFHAQFMATVSGVGGSLLRARPAYVAEIEIPVPPIEEQLRIAAILDKADEIRTKRRAALAQLDTLTQAIFLDLFGETHTHEVPLGDFADIVSGITIGRNLTDKKVETVPYLTVANVQDRRLNLKVVKTTLATEEEISRYAMQHHDILLTEGGDPDKLGRGCLWKNEIEGCIHQNHVFRVRMKTDALQPTFVSGLLSSPKGKRYFLRSAKQTTGIASINATQLRQFPVFLPSAETQANYRNAVEATSELEIRLNSALEAASEVFASLQRSLFNPT
jgi:type I restriction enzyme, S subunit